MPDRRRKIRGIIALGAAIALAAGQATAAGPRIKTPAVGLSYENFSRTTTWKGDIDPSKIRANLFSAKVEFGFAKGAVMSLSAGLVLTDFKALTFMSLPISLQYDGAPLKGLALGAEILAPFLKFSDFEISGTGRFVYSFGMSKTWPLEGFAVNGEAKGKSSWMEAAAGPRVSYLFFGRFVPYLEVCARWLRADFEMTETLDDLGGDETKRLPGDVSFSAALGADANVSERLSIRAKACILPYAGGVDGLVSIGLFYGF